MKDLTSLWEGIDFAKDYRITYLLYKEGKSIDLIAKIRRMSEEQVKKEIILAKTEQLQIKDYEKSILEKMLEASKDERIKLIENMSVDERKYLGKKIYYSYERINNAEDKAVLIWIIGELGLLPLSKILYKDINHPHGNVRRMVCSALYKLGDEKGIFYLHKALLDKKPQVRQYAAKALGKIGNEQSKMRLERLIHNPNEKDYVKKAFYEAIEHIERKLKKSNE
ncbi:HEAT repeat domain-containing protein [Inediibacterium massiliense]|uniref:HEAT repeat domain-containing protein n=1 Tax=Inediibacterium massiliense TaxID=1658111 RepID=UPI0006B68CD4|nr:HEAT repeat domain-containing protein [Inediibacterium massiliense]